MSDPQTPTPRTPGTGTPAGQPGVRPPTVRGLPGYEAALEYELCFRAYPNPRKGTPTHSVHIIRPTGPTIGELVEIRQGPLTQLIKDALIGGYMRKVADVPAEPVQLAFDFAEVA